MSFKYNTIPVKKPRRKACNSGDSTQEVESDFVSQDDEGFKPSRSLKKNSSNATKSKEVLLKIINEKIHILRSWDLCTIFLSDLQKRLSQNCESSGLDIVCYGIGSILESSLSQWQFALVIVLSGKLEKPGNIFFYDPVSLSDVESAVLGSFKVDIIGVNEEGRRKIENPTLFYMPHCPLSLYDHVLQANWDENAFKKLFLLGNLLINYHENMPDSKLRSKAPYVLEVSKLKPEAIDFPTFEDCPRAFNDLSFQILPKFEDLPAIDNSIISCVEDAELVL